MSIKQWFKEPTPKQFVYTSFIYAIAAPLIGVFIAEPIMSAMMMFFLLLFAAFTSIYLRPAIPSAFSNVMSGILPFIMLFTFFMTSSISYTEIIENKNQLEKVSDVIPEKAAYRRVGKNRSSSLLIEDIRLHCRYSDRDACNKVYDYAGQKAHVLYQSDTFIGNVVYEIKVGEQDIYSFEEQVAYFKDEKTKQHQQWFFVFLLFIIPAYWFYKHDKRINKSMPKLTDLEVAELKEKQREETENQGCAVLLGVI